MNYYQHHIGDFNSATRHLTRVERCLYRDLIEMYYDTEKAIKDDFPLLCRRLMCRSEDEKQSLRNVLDDFFTLENGVYKNDRCEKEIEAYHSRLSAKSRAGKASAAARSKKKASKNHADDEQVLTGVEQKQTSEQQNPTNQEPITNNQEPVTNNNTLVETQKVSTPHNEIRAIWAEVMPELSQPRTWNASRQKDLRARFMEDDKRQNLDWWKGFFEYIRESDFLMGRSESDRKWQINLPWLLRSNNFCKVLDGNYENK